MNKNKDYRVPFIKQLCYRVIRDNIEKLTTLIINIT